MNVFVYKVKSVYLFIPIASRHFTKNMYLSRWWLASRVHQKTNVVSEAFWQNEECLGLITTTSTKTITMSENRTTELCKCYNKLQVKLKAKLTTSYCKLERV